MKLGDKCKAYEMIETSQTFIPGLPIYVRIDGRAFSKFTKGMARPYEENMSKAMIETTRDLVREFGAVVGYTQSDEISLVLHYEGFEIPFKGKKQKLISSLAAFATASFMKNAIKYFPDRVEKRVPTFDCRAFNVPSKNEAVENIIWRVRDAIKNSYTMAASAYYPHKQLQGKNSKDKRELLLAKGIDFNDYPVFFREGTFIKNVQEEKEMDDVTWDKIPEKSRPESRFFVRRDVREVGVEDFESMLDKEAFIFSKYHEVSA